ncbi:VOC family protein [Williamsia phyllosphaerae]|uniref:Glyoxalase n=1 Tax=Williamsia phyllosphaerae TaxID=885042 RepID=A0ABQ1U367_9NOCA|nr:VOC family protein [Williamsia phyllosphaerae]GGF08717.1 glyoxalase [Williamsia phyllosphaerae]
MTGPIRPDPFTALRAVDTDVDPASVFSRQLRARLERGADLPRGVVMSGVTADQTAPTGIIERPGALPYLTVADGLAAIDWYRAHLGARLRGEPILMDDGRVGHAELEIGGGVIYLAAAFDEIGLAAPAPGAVSVSLMLAVDNTDRALSAARAGGASVQREPYEGHGSRTAVIIDPFGHRWMLSGPVRTPTGVVDRVRPGDVVYPSLCTPDVERAVRFYGAVLGWRYDAETRQVTNLGHRLGLSTLGDLRSLFLVYAVADLEGAREAIVAAGGTDLTEADGHPGSLDASDDQGARFAVYVADPDEVRGEQHPAGHGELTYITVHTPDSRAFRDFHSRVLGWEFTAGRVDDGWEVDDSRPQIGIAGGADEYSVVAMWSVDDIEAAVTRVREAGGEVISGPERMPYATTAECVDDQGVRFYLGQY